MSKKETKPRKKGISLVNWLGTLLLSALPGINVIAWVLFCIFGKNRSKDVYKRQLLEHLAAEGVYGVSQVFTREEIQEKERLSGEFAFALETDGYTTFGQRVTRPIVSNYDTTDYRYGHATHGYLPVSYTHLDVYKRQEKRRRTE